MLESATPDFDDDARRRLVTACRKLAPDVTLDEIAEFVRRKRAQLSRGGKRIDNPVGLLLAAAPRSLEGSGLLEYRRQLAEQIRRKNAETAAYIADCEKTISDTEASEEQKALARECIRTLKAG